MVEVRFIRSYHPSDKKTILFETLFDLFILFLYHAGHCIIQILPEISCKNLNKNDIPALLEQTQQVMQAEYDKLNAETKATHIKQS